MEVADKPKRVLGPGAVCCGESCGLEGCEVEVAPAVTELDLTDDMASKDKA